MKRQDWYKIENKCLLKKCRHYNKFFRAKCNIFSCIRDCDKAKKHIEQKFDRKENNLLEVKE